MSSLQFIELFLYRTHFLLSSLTEPGSLISFGQTLEKLFIFSIHLDLNAVPEI